MYGFHKGNVGVDGFFVWGDCVWDEVDCSHCGLDGVEECESCEHFDGDVFFLVCECVPGGDIVGDGEAGVNPELFD